MFKCIYQVALGGFCCIKFGFWILSNTICCINQWSSRKTEGTSCNAGANSLTGILGLYNSWENQRNNGQEIKTEHVSLKRHTRWFAETLECYLNLPFAHLAVCSAPRDKRPPSPVSCTSHVRAPHWQVLTGSGSLWLLPCNEMVQNLMQNEQLSSPVPEDEYYCNEHTKFLMWWIILMGFLIWSHVWNKAYLILLYFNILSNLI